jgi:beta-glucosidase
MLFGNYNGKASQPVTILEGIKQIAGAGIAVSYDAGCPLALKKDGSNNLAPGKIAQVVASAKSADAIIFVGGLDATLEKEEGNARQDIFEGFSRGDRTQIELPSPQEDLLKALRATGKPVVFVNCSGSTIAMPWAAKNLPAILQAWYPGEQGGRAVAEVLFGDINPAGRLPITFYRSTADLPAFENYSMSNRTYRYFSGKPLFAFGHGLSYTKFKYSSPQLGAASYRPDDTIKLSFTLQNTGKYAGDEVPQIYFRHVKSAEPQAKLALCGFTRVHLNKGQSAAVSIDILVKNFRYWDTAQKNYVVENGKYELLIGGASDDARLRVTVTISTPL